MHPALEDRTLRFPPVFPFNPFDLFNPFNL